MPRLGQLRTQCRYGHDANEYVRDVTGMPYCRRCNRERIARRRAGHAPVERLTGADFFWSKVDRRGGGECWPWTGTIGRDGYGTHAAARAYRVAYELLVGPVPEGMTLDHTCHTNDLTCPSGRACLHRRCVNPAHLEPVSRAENTRRQLTARRSVCPRGHLRTEESVRHYVDPRGKRRQICLVCLANAKRRAAA